jgi:hypothetical protein
MKLNIKIVALIAAVVVALALPGVGLAKGTGKGHVAVGTISSIDNNQVVINEKVNGKEQPMTFKLDSSTKKAGSLTAGSMVTIHYRTQNNQNVATSVRERGAKSAHTNTAKKSKTS